MSEVNSYYHGVFSTKERRNLISLELRERLYPFLGGGIARQHRMKILEIGGMPDHVHCLNKSLSSRLGRKVPFLFVACPDRNSRV